jgi:hypothetical protein
MKSGPSEASLLSALDRTYSGQKAFVVSHLSLGDDLSWTPGARLRPQSEHTTVRRIDAVVMFKDRSWAVEIKISRADLNRELANPAKTTLWRRHTSSFYYLVPPELLEYALLKVPTSSGVMSTSPGGRVQVHRRSARNLEPRVWPQVTLLRMMRALGKAQRELRRTTR